MTLLTLNTILGLFTGCNDIQAAHRREADASPFALQVRLKFQGQLLVRDMLTNTSLQVILFKRMADVNSSKPDALSSRPSYFEAYRDDRPSDAPRQYAPRSRRHKKPVELLPTVVVPSFPVDDPSSVAASSSTSSSSVPTVSTSHVSDLARTSPSDMDLSAYFTRASRRQASARHSRQPSSGGSPGTSSSPFGDINLNAARQPSLSTDSLDALYEALPNSPGRRGRPEDRSRSRTQIASSQTQQHTRREQAFMDQHGKELKAKLQHLATTSAPSSHTMTSTSHASSSHASSRSSIHSHEDDEGSAVSLPCYRPSATSPALLPIPHTTYTSARDRDVTPMQKDYESPLIPFLNQPQEQLPSPLPQPGPVSSPAQNLSWPQAYQRFPAPKPPAATNRRIPSIQEIVTGYQNHSVVGQTPTRHRSAPPKPAAPVSSIRPYKLTAASRPCSDEGQEVEDDDCSSVDSILAEAVRSAGEGPDKAASRPPLPPAPVAQSSRSLSDASRPSLSSPVTPCDDQSHSRPSPSRRSTSSQSSEAAEIAMLLHSPRLTRILYLPGPSLPFQVSYADVGHPDGHPVIVFLGLGCVRYLVALFDELATALRLRLICLDRWGIGKTTDVPTNQHGFQEWAKVVDALVDHLRLQRFSLLAHSAGAPYALATSLRCASRIAGSIHLLSPWVNTSAGGQSSQYKMLKYLPSSLLTTAQAAEWKVQAWRLGRPPPLDVSETTLSACHSDDVHEHGLQGGRTHRGLASSHALTPSPADSTPKLKGNTQESHSYLESRSPLTNGIQSSRQDPGNDRWDAQDAEPEAPGGISLSADPAERSRRSRKPSMNHSKQPSLAASAISNADSLLAIPQQHPDSNASPAQTPLRDATPTQVSPSALTTALLKASYSESRRGGAKDLLAILERSSKPAGFSYAEIRHPVQVWHGAKDERVSVSSVQAFHAALPDSRLHIFSQAGHDLMTDSSVMFNVLESIRDENVVTEKF